MRSSVLPRFQVIIGCPQQAVAANLARVLASRDCECRGWIELPYAELHVPDAVRRGSGPRRGCPAAVAERSPR